MSGIESFIVEADIIIVLVSLNYINYCEEEMKLIETKKCRKKVKIFNVHLNRCFWQKTFLKDFVSLPFNSEYSTFSTCQNENNFWFEVAWGIEKVLELLDSKPKKFRISVNVPISPSPVRAGDTGIGYDESSVFETDDSIEITDSKEGDILFKISGDSMKPVYSDGDYVLCRRVLDKSDLKESKKYVFKTRDRGYFLKYFKTTDKSNISLVSANKETEAFKVPKEDILEVWQVVKSIKIADE